MAGYESLSEGRGLGTSPPLALIRGWVGYESRRCVVYSSPEQDADILAEDCAGSCIRKLRKNGVRKLLTNAVSFIGSGHSARWTAGWCGVITDAIRR